MASEMLMQNMLVTVPSMTRLTMRPPYTATAKKSEKRMPSSRPMEIFGSSTPTTPATRAPTSTTMVSMTPKSFMAGSNDGDICEYMKAPATNPLTTKSTCRLANGP